MKIKLVIADDHPMVVKGLADILRPYEHMEIQAAFGKGKELLAALPSLRPDILMLDVQLPDMEGEEIVRELRKACPELRILVVSSIDTPYRIREMLQLGCRGYLLKSTAPETLIEAIEKIYKGEEFLEPGMRDRLLASVIHPDVAGPKHIRLTRRELEILKLVCEGLNNYDIGAKLFLSHRTVENHRSSLHQKFEVKNSVALVRAAMHHGFI